VSDPSAATPEGASVIHDLGYRPYTGLRLGPAAIAIALGSTSIEVIFGAGGRGSGDGIGRPVLRGSGDRVGLVNRRAALEGDSRSESSRNQNGDRGRLQRQPHPGGAADPRHPCLCRLAGVRARGFQHHPQEGQRNEHAGSVAECRPGAVDRLPGAAAAEAECRRDLLVAESLHLAHHDRRSLRLGQRLEPLDQVREFLSHLHFLRRAAAARHRLGQ